MNREPTIGQYMTPCPHTIGHDQTLAQAHRMMQAHGIRHLPVLKAGRLLGILSSRDLYFVETLQEVEPDEVTVDEAMTPAPYMATAETPLEQAATAMAERHYGCAIVTDGRGIVGILTTIDALRALATLLRERRAA